MHTPTAHNIDIREVDCLLSQLHHLLQAHRAELGEQELDHELEWLTDWIDQFRHGDTAAKKQIDEHALKMLVSIRNTLAQATMEEQRMQAESPLSSPPSEAHTTALRDTRRDVGNALDSFLKAKDLRPKKAG